MAKERKLSFISYVDIESCSARGDYMLDVKTKAKGTWTASVKVTFGEQGISGNFSQ